MQTPVSTAERRSLPRLNEPAPDFEATTTQGPIKLSDLRGKWVVLFSHPADFTPVCSTEFMAFARSYDEFTKRNAVLIGISVDSVYSHIAWIRNIEEKAGVKIPFPVVADLDMKVAQQFGMIHPGEGATATVRTVFFIDDKGIVRAMIYYPMSCGRSIDEIIRVLDALQTADKNGVATPANWRPGEDVVVPAPATQEGAEKRLGEQGLKQVDWYLSTKPLPR
ncbi:MAG TPA: peroxiredoxin [Chloroflexota bacterium]|nr:peroxiredoxin [Chloroflexota bacterium]